MNRRCMGCMKLTQGPVCQHCGLPEEAQNENHQLPIGAILREQYVVGKVLGQGGFGITYLGWDQSLEEPVAIKEYFPNGQVSRNTYRSTVVECTSAQDLFQEGRERFLREARTLAKLRKMTNIVQVHSFFVENNTAYIVMEYVEGITLLEYMRQRGGKLSVSETFTILRPVLKALSQVHQAGMIHRDISPDNLMLQDDGTVKILDFGTARDVDRSGGQLTHSTQAVLKHGFAPMEQYSGGRTIDQRADEYALCATVWYCLTGQLPPDAPSLIMDGSQINWKGIPGLTEQQVAALEKGTAFRADDRFPNLIALHEALFGAPPEFTTRGETTSSILLHQEPEAPAPQFVDIPGTVPMPEHPAQPPVIPETKPMPEAPKEKPKWAAAPPEELLGGQPKDWSKVTPPAPDVVPDGASWVCASCGTSNRTGVKTCQGCGVTKAWSDSRMEKQPQLPNNVPAPAPEPERKGKKLVPIIACLLVAGFLCAYIFSYIGATGNARDGNFKEAESQLFAPFITELHDPQLVDYVEAGRLMQRGQYAQARSAFRRLGNYMNAPRLEKNAAYQQGVALMENGDTADFIEADEIFTWLADWGYAGADEKYKENRYRWACILIREDDYFAAYDMLDPLRGYSDVDEMIATLTEMIYVEGQYQYLIAKDYDYAKELFTFLSNYQDSEKYLTLIKAKQHSGSIGAAQIAEDLVEILDFEDAAEVLVANQDIAMYFLLGKWQTKNKKYYFEMEKETNSGFSCSATLPKNTYDGYFYISDGLYSVGKTESSAKPLFRFTVLTKDSMKVYCYKNDTTYTLYR